MCLTAAIAARERALRYIAHAEHNVADSDAVAHGASQGPTDIPFELRQEHTKKFVMYGSTQTHSIGAKSAVLLGMPFRALPVKAEDEYALRGDVLKAAIEEDIAKGMTPLFVSAYERPPR